MVYVHIVIVSIYFNQQYNNWELDVFLKEGGGKPVQFFFSKILRDNTSAIFELYPYVLLMLAI